MLNSMNYSVYRIWAPHQMRRSRADSVLEDNPNELNTSFAAVFSNVWSRSIDVTLRRDPNRPCQRGRFVYMHMHPPQRHELREWWGVFDANDFEVWEETVHRSALQLEALHTSATPALPAGVAAGSRSHNQQCRRRAWAIRAARVPSAVFSNCIACSTLDTTTHTRKMSDATYQPPPLTGLRVLELAGLAPGTRNNCQLNEHCVNTAQGPLQACSSPTTVQQSSASTARPPTTQAHPATN